MAAHRPPPPATTSPGAAGTYPRSSSDSSTSLSRSSNSILRRDTGGEPARQRDSALPVPAAPPPRVPPPPPPRGGSTAAARPRLALRGERAAPARPSPPPPAAAPRTRLARCCAAGCRVGMSGRGGREGGAGSRPDPSPGFCRADPPPCLSGAASLRGGPRLAVAPGGVAKPRRGCENGRRGVSEGREPRTSEGSHVSVQAVLSAGSAEGPHHAHASERTLECAVTLRVAATGGG